MFIRNADTILFLCFSYFLQFSNPVFQMESKQTSRQRSLPLNSAPSVINHHQAMEKSQTLTPLPPSLPFSFTVSNNAQLRAWTPKRRCKSVQRKSHSFIYLCKPCHILSHSYLFSHTCLGISWIPKQGVGVEYINWYPFVPNSWLLNYCHLTSAKIVQANSLLPALNPFWLLS